MIIDFLTRHRKVFIDTLYVISGAGFSRGFSFLSSIIVARHLGVSEFGKFTIFYISLDLTWQFAEAFDTTFICYAKASTIIDQKKSLLKSAILMKIYYVIIVMVTLLPVYVLNKYGFQDRDIFNFIIAGIIAGSFLSFLRTITNTFREKEEFGKFSFLNALHTASILLVLIMLLVLDINFRLVDVVSIYLIITVGIGAICFGILAKQVGNVFAVDRVELARSFSFGKWIFATSIVYFLFQRADVLMMTRYVGYDDIGVYSVAVQLLMIISLVAGSLNAIFLPKSINAVKKKELFKKYLIESFLPLTAVILILIAMLVTAPYCINFIYGNAYSKASPILRILLIGWLFTVCCLPFSFVFFALNDAKTKFVLEAFKLISVIVLMLIFVPSLGITGGAISLSIAISINAILSVFIVKRRLTTVFMQEGDKTD